MIKTTGFLKTNISFFLAFFFIGTAFVSAASAKVTLTLVNANTNRDLYKLNGGDTINLNKTGKALNIRADVSRASFVRFHLNGRLVQTERKAPYALGGDTNGNYHSWTPAVRTHDLQVTVHDASERIIDQRSIRFRVIGGSNNNTYQHWRGDIVSLHYDMSPDPDDGHSAAADVSIYNKHKYRRVVVLGTMSKYGPEADKDTFHQSSQDLFQSLHGSNWNNAYRNWNGAVMKVARRWREALKSGGHVWIKEGGPSDFSAEVIRELQNALRVSPAMTRARIHLIQHGNLNETWTNKDNLRFVQGNANYIKIADGNTINATAGLNSSVFPPRSRLSQIKRFQQIAYKSSSSAAWRAAFHFWNPEGKKDTHNDKFHRWHRLDFSDTVELLRILGIDKGKVRDCTTFANFFLKR